MYKTLEIPRVRTSASAVPRPEFRIGTHELMSAGAELGLLAKRLSSYAGYCSQQKVPLLQPLMDGLASTLESVRELVLAQLERGKSQQEDSDDWYLECEYLCRAALQTKSYVIQCLEWCAPAYLQSNANQFFDLAAQGNTRVNYERYESNEVGEIEQRLAHVFGYDAGARSVLVTSSGMAAYNVVEGLLIRDILEPGDTVLVSPYIYFEASEQLKALKGFRVTFADSYDADLLLQQIGELQPRAVFLDPLSNTPEQRVIDLGRFFQRLGDMVQGKIAVVVDGTMVPGCFREEWSRSPNVDILYYESCSKYLQLGFDTTMAGYVLAPTPLRDRLYEIRRNTGSILARDCAHTFPAYDAELIGARMRRIGANAISVMDYFAESRAAQELVSLHYPGHHSHVDFEVGRQYTTMGGCVSIKFHTDNSYEKLNRYIAELVRECARRKVRLIKGVSFGHTVPRISASSALAGFDKPYLRLFVGALGASSMLGLCEAMEHVLLERAYLQGT